MLETKGLVKVYKPKKGVPVKALDNVTLKFPDKGMVFLLGKSGSGKSTLLNVLGGLDNYNGGEIIIKGVSSKDFKQKHFDSYRNTYVGFIFQEYNVLDDFTVGANIALAIELQNRKAKDSEINEILKEVDLEGFGERKPNELSGGQKQRVAIARALVKKPEIIMADEPTGALDSATGKQVLDTLKKLSRNKLVIVVSHDREFAESYADRIIELSDGKVISDVEADNNYIGTEETLSYNGNQIEVPSGYHLTEEDRRAINDYIDGLKNEKLSINVKAKAGLGKRFKPTDTNAISRHSGSEFKLIKSKLPFKNAFKIGTSALKYKKIRLVITILLSCISFGLFGLADTFGAYNHVKTCTNSLIDSGVDYLSVAKSKKIGNGVDTYWRDYGYKLSDEDISSVSKNVGTKMHGVYKPLNGSLSFEEQINPEIKLTETEYNIYNTYFRGGFTEINEDIIKQMGFKVLAGRLPLGNMDEIAISEYIFEVFKKAEYFDTVTFITEKDGTKKPVYQKINTYDDILGKTIKLNDVKYVVTAIIDTGFDTERYSDLTVKNDNLSKAEKLLKMVLFEEYSSSASYSYAGLVMLGEGGMERILANRPPVAETTEGYIDFYSEKYGVHSSFLAILGETKDEKIIWINGAKDTLNETEIIVTKDALMMYEGEISDNDELIKFLKENNSLTSFQQLYEGEAKNVEGYKIVGFIDNTAEKSTSKLDNTIICADSIYRAFTEGKDYYYSFAVGAMPKEKDKVYEAVEYCYRDGNLRYQIQNSVTFELDAVNEGLQMVSEIFLWVGLGFALFAALMLANFIATSISYKKQEIGILRAIGSRSNDVFRIFFAESFVIALINFVLSAVGVFAVTIVINGILRNEAGLLVTVLSFGVRQIILLLGVSILVAFIASFIPVKRIASKKPIDAIRNR